jgi:hypothetical protein
LKKREIITNPEGWFVPMSLSLLSAMVLSTALMNVEADSLSYLDPPSPWWPSYSYAFSGGNSILREQGERLLLRETEPLGYRTYAVIALVNAEYERVRDMLRRLVTEKWGVIEEQYNAAGPIQMGPPRMGPPAVNIVNENLRWPILGEGLAHLAGQRSLKAVREYQLTSQPYNQIKSLNSFSQVVMRVSDGSTLFDHPVTILQVTRTDRSREWARTHDFHGIIPLPYKEEWWSVGIVTSTEITLIEEVKQHLPGASIRYFVGGSFVSEDREGQRVNIIPVREKMQEAIEQLKKP